MGKGLSAETLKLLDEADAILARAFEEVRAKLRDAPDDWSDRFPVCLRCDCVGFVASPGIPSWKCRRAGCGHSLIVHGLD